MKTPISAVFGIIVLAGFTGCISMQSRHMKSVEPASGTLTLQGLKKPVVIRRDKLGVPRIEAQNEDDLFFATGYTMASDRLWQMVMMKRTIQGRLSETSGKKALPIDIFMRNLNVKSHIRAAKAELDARSLKILASFARGVNAYIETHRDLPAEFVLAKLKPEKWEPEDSLYIFAMLNLFLSFNMIEELDFLVLAGRIGYDRAAWLVPVYPDTPLPREEVNKLKSIPRGELAVLLASWRKNSRHIRNVLPLSIPASNNWALAGKRTKSRRPLLANDTHLVLSLPCPWYMVNLRCPTFKAAGVAVPGIPIVTLGYNGRLSWGATMVTTDTQDIFIEKIRRRSGGLQFLYKGKWLPVREHAETITVKRGKPVKITIRTTSHGILLNEALAAMPFPPDLPVQPMPMKSRFGLALKWHMEGMGATFRGFYSLARSRTVYEARRAARNIHSIYLNLVMSDGKNIAWQVTGKVPVRKKGRGLLPSPGWDGLYDWKGFLPFEALPHSINPPEGYIATANNRTVPKNYPYHITSTWYHPDRGDYLKKRLSSMRDATLDDMRALQASRYSPMAKKVQDLLFYGPVSRQIKGIIRSWKGRRRMNALEALEFLKPGRFDCVMKASSASAAVLGAFTHVFVHWAFLDELGPVKSAAWLAFLDLNSVSYSAPEDHIIHRDDSPFWDNIATPEKETKAHILSLSLAGSVRLCEKKMGGNRGTWQWGRMHAYHFKHDISKTTSLFNRYLNRGPYPAGGDVHTLNVAGYIWGKNFDVWMIPAMRMLVDYGKKEPVYMVLAPGESGNPSSPHYDSMLPLYLQVKKHPLPFGEEAVRRHYRTIRTLVPAKSGR